MLSTTNSQRVFEQWASTGPDLGLHRPPGPGATTGLGRGWLWRGKLAQISSMLPGQDRVVRAEVGGVGTREPFWPHGGPSLHTCGLTSGQSRSATPWGGTGRQAEGLAHGPSQEGREQRATDQARQRAVSWMGDPGSCPNPHTFLLPQSFSHAKATCQECAGAPGSQKAKETPRMAARS